MNSYEEIKQFLEKKDFQSALLVAFSNSLKFKLTTKINNPQESSSIETTIDLLKGVTNKVSDESILESQSNLMKFHRSQLEKVHDIWDTNRQIIIAILKVLANNDEFDSSNFKTSFAVNSLTSSDVENHSADFEHNVNDIVDLMLDESEAEEEEFISSAQKTADESWTEFMDGLSAEEEAVTEKVIVNEAPSDEEIDDWSEWVDIENEDDSEKIDWNQEDWQEEEEIISNS